MKHIHLVRRVMRLRACQHSEGNGAVVVLGAPSASSSRHQAALDDEDEKKAHLRMLPLRHDASVMKEQLEQKLACINALVRNVDVELNGTVLDRMISQVDALLCFARAIQPTVLTCARSQDVHVPTTPADNSADRRVTSHSDQ